MLKETLESTVWFLNIPHHVSYVKSNYSIFPRVFKLRHYNEIYAVSAISCQLYSPMYCRWTVPLSTSVYPSGVSWSEPNHKNTFCEISPLSDDRHRCYITMQTVNNNNTDFYPCMTSQSSFCVVLRSICSIMCTHCWIHVFINSRVSPDTLHSAGKTQSRELQRILIIIQGWNDTMYSKKETAFCCLSYIPLLTVSSICAASP